MYCVFQVWTVKRFVEWQHHFFVIVLEIPGNESEYIIISFAALFCLLLPLEVFGEDDSKISAVQLLAMWRLD